MLKATFFATSRETRGDGDEGLERGCLLLRVLRGSKPDERGFGATETTRSRSAGRTSATGVGASLTPSLASTPGLFGGDFITCSHKTGDSIVDDALGLLWTYIVINSPLPSSLTAATSTPLTGSGLSAISSTPGGSRSLRATTPLSHAATRPLATFRSPLDSSSRSPASPGRSAAGPDPPSRRRYHQSPCAPSARRRAGTGRTTPPHIRNPWMCYVEVHRLCRCGSWVEHPLLLSTVNCEVSYGSRSSKPSNLVTLHSRAAEKYQCCVALRRHTVPYNSGL
jgi:hypothetical protein